MPSFCWHGGLCHQLLVPVPTEEAMSRQPRKTSIKTAWTAIDRLSVIRKSNLTDKIKLSFFQTVLMSILLYGCTTWMLTKHMEKRLGGNYSRMLRAILNSSWTATHHPSRKLSKLDELDTWDTAGEVKTCSKAIYSSGPLHMDEQMQDDQLEPIHNNSVPI